MLWSKSNIQLNYVIRRLDEIKRSIVTQAAIYAQPAIKAEIEQAFAGEISPAEKKWAPLKPQKSGGKLKNYSKDRKILRGLVDYFTTILSGVGKISVRNSKWYTKFHQSGTKYMEDRRFLPAPGEVVHGWEDRVSAPIKKKVNRMLGGSL